MSPGGGPGAHPLVPDDGHERRVRESGCRVVAGVDEVGRGAWAGPLTVGVVVVPAGDQVPEGVRDSKLLSERRREALYPAIVSWCGDWAVGHASPAECDQWGMTRALALAARRALGALDLVPDAVLLDGTVDFVTDPGGRDGPHDPEACCGGAWPRVAPVVETVVGGDRRCVSIAAASIVAKVTRDRIMRSFAPSFPAFDFASNKGYPAPVHRRALAGYGLTAIHRRSWSYVADLPFR